MTQREFEFALVYYDFDMRQVERILGYSRGEIERLVNRTDSIAEDFGMDNLYGLGFIVGDALMDSDISVDDGSLQNVRDYYGALCDIVDNNLDDSGSHQDIDIQGYAEHCLTVHNILFLGFTSNLDIEDKSYLEENLVLDRYWYLDDEVPVVDLRDDTIGILLHRDKVPPYDDILPVHRVYQRLYDRAVHKLNRN